MKSERPFAKFGLTKLTLVNALRANRRPAMKNRISSPQAKIGSRLRAWTRSSGTPDGGAARTEAVNRPLRRPADPAAGPVAGRGRDVSRHFRKQVRRASTRRPNAQSETHRRPKDMGTCINLILPLTPYRLSLTLGMTSRGYKPCQRSPCPTSTSIVIDTVRSGAISAVLAYLVYR